MEQSTVAPPINHAFLEDFAQRWLEAWNTQNADKVLACMAEDIVYNDDAWPTTMRGHADVRAFLDSSWRAFPDMRFEVIDGPYINPDAPKVAWYWRGFATHTGPLDPPGLAPTGKRIEFEGGEFDEFRDGKLVRLKMAFDMADAMRQLAVLPPVGSRAERFTIRLANLQTKLRRR